MQREMYMYNEIAREHSLFEGLTDAEYSNALKLFSAEWRKHLRGTMLSRQGDVMQKFGLIASGNVQIYSYDMDGTSNMMASVERGGTFAEAICYLKEPVYVHIFAETDTMVLWLDPSHIMQINVRHTPLERKLMNRFTAMLARKAIGMNERIQVLSKITLREKLVTLFSQCVARYGTMQFTLPYDRQGMAAYLGTNRSALSRELSNMKAEGLIDFHKNSFVIKNKAEYSLW